MAPCTNRAPASPSANLQRLLLPVHARAGMIGRAASLTCRPPGHERPTLSSDRRAHIVLVFQVGAAVKQQLCHWDVTAARCKHQHRTTILRPNDQDESSDSGEQAPPH